MGFLGKLFGGGKKKASPDRRRVQKVLGYLDASDLQEDQTLTLKIKYTHWPGPEAEEDTWREISFWERRDRLLCNQTLRLTLLNAFGEDWIGKRVNGSRTKTEIAGQPTDGLRVLPVEEDMGIKYTCGRCGYKGSIEEVRPSTPIKHAPGDFIPDVGAYCINLEHCSARSVERLDKMGARKRFLDRPFSDPRYTPPGRRRPARPWW